MSTNISNKQYIGDIQLNREPDLILEVDQTTPFNFYYNGECGYDSKNDRYNISLNNYLRVYPNENGICEIYLPKKVTNIASALSVIPSVSGLKPNSIKKIIGLNKFFEKHPECKSSFGICIAKEQCNVEYFGDIEHLDVSNLENPSIWIIFLQSNYYNTNPVRLGTLDLRSWQPYKAKLIDLANCNYFMIDISTWDFDRIDCTVDFANSEYLKKIKIPSNFTTSKFKSFRFFLHGCKEIEEIPFVIDCSSIINNPQPYKYHNPLQSVLHNCSSLKSATFANTDGENCNFWWGSCLNCSSLEELNGISLKYAYTVGHLIYGCSKLKKFLVKDIGYTDWKFCGENATLPWCPENSIDLAGAPNWGADNEENRKTLVDSLLTYSFDRSGTARHIYNILLHPNVIARLTDEEKAAITAKGYNLIGK